MRGTINDLVHHRYDLILRFRSRIYLAPNTSFFQSRTAVQNLLTCKYPTPKWRLAGCWSKFVEKTMEILSCSNIVQDSVLGH